MKGIILGTIKTIGTLGTIWVLLLVTSCKAPKVVVQDRVVTRDSVIVLLRDTIVYVEIERGVNTDVRYITDTVFLENKFATSQAYVMDSMIFLQLVQKQQTLPFRIQYLDERHVSERDSVVVRTEVVEVNRLTMMQSFWVVCGQGLLVLFAAVIVFFVVKTYLFKK